MSVERRTFVSGLYALSVKSREPRGSAVHLFSTGRLGGTSNPEEPLILARTTHYGPSNHGCRLESESQGVAAVQAAISFRPP